jgi:ketosteroid isomerase-like protein
MDTRLAMSQGNVEIVRNALQALDRGDDDAVVECFRRDCEIHHPPELPDAGAIYRGASGVREWIASMRQVMGADVRFDGLGYTANGDVVVVEATGSGIGSGSGVPMQWATFLVFDMREGMIARARGFLKKQQALAAAGLLE